QLSQRRANSVLSYFIKSNQFRRFTPVEQEKFRFWLMSNGMAYGRAFDKRGEYVYESKQPIDNVSSLRVEFRMVTTSDEVVKQILEKIQEQNEE
ncbi:MAG: hypothetical protein AAF740_14065, partial [Bacteroidota bacterium]